MNVQISCLLAAALVVSGCAEIAPVAEDNLAVAVNTKPGDDVLRPILRPGDETSEAGDEGTAETTQPLSQGAAFLGRTIASLGDISRPGLWAETPLVGTKRPGRLELPGGPSIEVELRPNGQALGAGTQLSLEAMQALGVSLTDLPELLVYGL